MPEGYVHIEWSGYWDFPTGSYSGGSKDLDAKSGFFDKGNIMLDGVGNVEYEIDPADIGVPKSPSFSFRLKNKHQYTGDELYPFDYISTLGRTEEYGGSFSDFGDLFIRVSIPMLNDKIIYKGIVEAFSYSEHDFEVEIKCTDFIGAIKDAEQKMFIHHELKNNELLSIDSNTVSIADSIDRSVTADITTSVNDINGTPIDFEKMTFRTSDVSGGPLVNEVGGRGTALNLYEYLLAEGLPAHPDDPLAQANEYIAYTTGWYKDLMKNQGFIKRFTESSLSNPYFKNLIPEWTFVNSNGDTGIYYEYTRWRPCFIKIEESTIYTMFRVGIRSSMNGYIFESDYVVENVNFWSEIEIVHANNGITEQVITEEDYIILGRGRFYKKAKTVANAEINVGDKLPIVMFDYRNTEEELTVAGQRPIVSIGFGSYGFDGGTLEREIFIHGIKFQTNNDTGEMKPYEFKGYFNSFLSGMDMIEGNFLDRYTDGVPDDLLFDYSQVLDNLFQHCYLSDVIHYGWIENKLSEIIVNYAYQISSYLYADEQGRITFKSRLLSYNSGSVFSNSVQIYKEDYEIVSPTDYNYGSKYYRIEYGDQLELNNLEGQDKVSFDIDKSGKILKTILKPQKLDVANFRTSDLGVPDEDEDIDILLRRSPILNDPSIPPEYFIRDPIDQATDIARGIGYPSKLFSIELDIMYGEAKGYFDIGIGSYLKQATDVPGKFDIFLSKKVNYSPKRLREKSTSLMIELLYLGSYVFEQFDEVFTISEDQSETVINSIYESFDEVFTISEDQSETVTDPPNPPENVSSTKVSECQNDIFWDAPSTGTTPDSYDVYADQDGGGFSVIANVPAGTTSYSDDLTTRAVLSDSASTFTYKLKSVLNSGAESGFSGTTSQTNDTTAC